MLTTDLVHKALLQQQVRIDSVGSAFLVNQLKDYKAVYNKEFQGYKCRGLFPVANRGKNMETVAIPRFEASTAYLISGSNPVNIPTIDGVEDEVTNKVRFISSSTSISLVEAARATMLGNQIDMKKLEKLREVFEDAVEDTTLKGQANKGLNGLFDLLAVTGKEAVNQYTVPNNGASSSRKFKDKTPAQIILQMFEFIDYAKNAKDDKNKSINNDKFKPVIVVVTPSVKLLFDTTPWAANASMNITDYIQKMKKVTIEDHGDNVAVSQLDDKDIMWAHTGNSMHLELVIPQEFQILAPQLVAFSSCYYGQGQIAGVQIAEPRSVVFAKEIS